MVGQICPVGGAIPFSSSYNTQKNILSSQKDQVAISLPPTGTLWRGKSSLFNLWDEGIIS